ncbi:MAG: tripartite tricarboxylate transporter permease [Dysgonamonadaceae bacterium]|nr:tripartite tricarboxylate transporter permease [Dysgonamonadaceae bacterium]
MDGLEILYTSLQEIFTIKILLLFIIGTISGMIIGSLPGLTTTMGVSLLITFTWGMSLMEALVVIISLHVGGTYGGSTAAIFLNIPGTPAAAATAMDGYPLAKMGKGSLVRGLATIQSSIGTVIGAFVFLFATPILVKFSLNFGSWEYFLLALFGIVVSAKMTSESMLLGIISGCLGLILATVGMDSTYGVIRFTFGITELFDGFGLIPVLIGIFGISEVIDSLINLKPPLKIDKMSSVIPRIKEIVKYQALAFRSTLFGVFIGSIPGVGADVACWVAYDNAKKQSKSPETFGKGNPEGVVAAETANNACVPGTYIPMLSLGIPGDSVTAVILGGLMLHGIQPGPLLGVERPELIYQFFLILLISAVLLLVIGLGFSSFFQKILLVPTSIVLTVVSVLCVVGTFAVNNRIFDIYVMVIFGFIGYGMKKLDLSIPPLVLGIILGPMAETNFRRAMISASYSFMPFITRPISLVLLILIVYNILINFEFFKRIKDQLFKKIKFNLN